MKVMLLGKEVDLLIGMDAEFFLKNDKGRYIAAARVIPGLKHDPHKLDNGVCHPDGLSLEVGAAALYTHSKICTSFVMVILCALIATNQMLMTANCMPIK